MTTKTENTSTATRAQNNSRKTNTSRTATNQSKSASRTAQKKSSLLTDMTTKKVSARPNKNTTMTASYSNIFPRIISRSATSKTSNVSFSETYNSCRDAYFTCMDQFCATQSDDYRRCVCSSRLTEIIAQEKQLAQTADNLQDFQNLNIDVISKSKDEVKSMLSASNGEKNIKQDTSNSAKTLNNISEVLKQSKKNALSTQGTLDIAGNIKNIWSITDLIGSSNIADLTGESLYNAVHAQCAEAVSDFCTQSDLTMVSSAYGMYIENDCSILATGLNSRKVAANTAIRTTRHQMQDARLDNYNAHNSLSLNECVARVKQDITQDRACGSEYTHCLDFSGKYLNINTGEPIYSSDFYQLESQLSLSGNVLKNETNAKFVNLLDKKRAFAEQSLDLCVDNADAAWDEFLRQAIVEIYQQQQQRVQDVKAECLTVVNECYLKQSDTLQNFSDNSSIISLGHTLELSEDLCAEKLTTCSNLYGGGPEGLAVLVNTMHNITDETIAQACPEMLMTFAKNICSVPVNDSAHSYPYGCRVYAPGEAMYARVEMCNATLVNPFDRSDILVSTIIVPNTYYVCPLAQKRYVSCAFNRYLYNETVSIEHGFSLNNASECRICPAGLICPGGKSKPQSVDSQLYDTCGIYYVGSLYQQLVRYALQNCRRPSDESYLLSESLLAEVNQVMQTVTNLLVSELSSECTNYNGTWVDIPWIDDDANGYHDTTGDTLNQDFYTRTGTNKLWGYCK